MPDGQNQQNQDPYGAYGGSVATTPDPYAAYGGSSQSGNDPHTVAASQPGAMQTRPGGPIINADNPDQSEQDPGVWQGFKDSISDTASGLYNLAKAQWKHSVQAPYEELKEGHYKQGVYDALKSVVLPDPNSPIHAAARNMVLDSLSNEYASLKNRAAAIEKIVSGDVDGAKKSAAQSVKSQIKAIPGVGPSIVKTGEDFNDRPGYAFGEGLGLEAQMAAPEAAPEALAAGGRALSKAGDVAEKLAPESMNSLLRANKQANYLYGKNPGKAFIDENIKIPKNSFSMSGQLENLHGQLETAADNVGQEIRDALSDPAVSAKRIDIVPVVKKSIGDAKAYVSKQTGLDVPKYIDELNKLEDNILTKYDPQGNSLGKVSNTAMSPQQVAETKTSIGKSTQWNVLPTDPEFKLKTYLNSVRKSIYGQLADTVESAAPDTNIKSLNSRLANIFEAQGLLEKRIALENGTGGFNAALRKGEFWGGLATALFSPEPLSKTLGSLGVADRVIRSIPGKMATAKTLAGAGDVLQDAGTAAQSPASRSATTVAGKAAQSSVAAHDSPNWIPVKLSDGRFIEVHPEDLTELQRRDPKLQVLSNPNDDQHQPDQSDATHYYDPNDKQVKELQ